MSFGRLSEDQEKVLAPFVKDKIVHDLGAGFCDLSLRLLELGASRVVAIDKDRMPRLEHLAGRVAQARATFAEAAGFGSPGGFSDEEARRARSLARTIDVAFLSWPRENKVPGLVELLGRARIVVYLGKNTDMSMCGWPGMFLEALLPRSVLAHAPEQRNTLIVYGPRSNEPRRILGEEAAALAAGEAPPRVVTWEKTEAHDAALEK